MFQQHSGETFNTQVIASSLLPRKNMALTPCLTLALFKYHSTDVECVHLSILWASPTSPSSLWHQVTLRSGLEWWQKTASSSCAAWSSEVVPREELTSCAGEDASKEDHAGTCAGPVVSRGHFQEGWRWQACRVFLPWRGICWEYSQGCH